MGPWRASRPIRAAAHRFSAVSACLGTGMPAAPNVPAGIRAPGPSRAGRRIRAMFRPTPAGMPRPTWTIARGGPCRPMSDSVCARPLDDSGRDGRSVRLRPALCAALLELVDTPRSRAGNRPRRFGTGGATGLVRISDGHPTVVAAVPCRRGMSFRRIGDAARRLPPAPHLQGTIGTAGSPKFPPDCANRMPRPMRNPEAAATTAGRAAVTLTRPRPAPGTVIGGRPARRDKCRNGEAATSIRPAGVITLICTPRLMPGTLRVPTNQ